MEKKELKRTILNLSLPIHVINEIKDEAGEQVKSISQLIRDIWREYKQQKDNG
jgi:hypothetical protein